MGVGSERRGGVFGWSARGMDDVIRFVSRALSSSSSSVGGKAHSLNRYSMQLLHIWCWCGVWCPTSQTSPTSPSANSTVYTFSNNISEVSILNPRHVRTASRLELPLAYWCRLLVGTYAATNCADHVNVLSRVLESHRHPHTGWQRAADGVIRLGTIWLIGEHSVNGLMALYWMMCTMVCGVFGILCVAIIPTASVKRYIFYVSCDLHALLCESHYMRHARCASDIHARKPTYDMNGLKSSGNI